MSHPHPSHCNIQVRKQPARLAGSQYSEGMSLDPDLCYLAIQSRDERFDGRFFTGVLTTGIYCRPICPARTPLRKNVRFFRCAAAAEGAGFRPCLRCRPETSPGTPAWLGSSAVVSRALQLMADGVLAEAGLDELARRLGTGRRQLRRLFQQHLGTSPIAVAQTQRLHFAKQLLDETSLPISEVAFCAGFSSIRRFNALFSQAYQQPPSQLRRQQLEPGLQASTLHLKLAYRPPLAWLPLIRFLQARAIPGVEQVEAERYRRLVRLGETVGVIEVQWVEGQHYLRLSVPSGLSKGLLPIVERVRRLFDLKADPEQISRQLALDPSLAPLLEAWPGLRLPGAWDSFELAVRAILGQQVSVQAATTLAGRLVKAYGEPVAAVGSNGLGYLFPSPETLAQADLSGLGLPSKRAAAIQGLAQAIHSGEFVLAGATGLEPSIAQLTALPGVGPWTAHYIAMRALAEPDAFPSGDLILRRAAAGKATPTLSEAELLRRAEAWRPWRAYAALYWWTDYTAKQEKTP